MTQTQDSYDHLMKLVLIGDSSVGKSNLLLRYSGKPFSLESKPTIGVEFCSKTVRLHDKSLKVQIWDTAGQERFRAITHAYYKGAVGAIIVYDVTRVITFENVEKWLKELRENCNEESIPIMLVGNKIDLQQQRMVKDQQGREYAGHNNLFFMETSAMDERGVNEAFESFVQQTYLKCKEHNILQKRRTALKEEIKQKDEKTKKKEEKAINLMDKIESLHQERCCV